MSKPKIILPRIIVADRLPPPPEFRVRLQPQHMCWEVGRYRERLRSGPGGLGRGRIWTPEHIGEQHNLILDAAGDLMASNYWDQLSHKGYVGTGTTAPSPSDTGMSGATWWWSTINPPTPPTTKNYVSQGVWDITIGREFPNTDVGGQNLGEWGFGPSGGGLITRELFRDNNGTPIVLSLSADQGVRLYYTYRLTLGPITQAVSINVANLGTITGTLGISRYSAGSSYDLDEFGNLATAVAQYDHGVFIYLSPQSFSYNSGPWGYDDFIAFQTAPNDNAPTFYNYVSGSRQRQFKVIIPTTNGNGTIYALGFGNTGTPAAGIYLTFDTGSEIAKDDIHKLILDPWTITW